MELFFDTETTGLPLFKEPATHPNQPDVIQLAAILSDENKIYASLNVLLNPSDINASWKMNPFAFAAHGISEETIRATGINTETALNLFLGLVELSDTLVCHNTSFDQKLVAGAMYKCHYPYEDLIKIEGGIYYCTMKSSTTLCGLKNKNGAPKWPKLTELYEFLFGETFENQHDALADVMATRRCYYELKRRGL